MNILTAGPRASQAFADALIPVLWRCIDAQADTSDAKAMLATMYETGLINGDEFTAQLVARGLVSE